MKDGLSPITYSAVYAPFTPNNSGQRSSPTYYRGCWHVVSRGFLLSYRHSLRHLGQKFTIRKPSSFTRRCWVRLAPIAQYSPLLPPVGVWTVSQFQCGRSPSQVGYPSSPWWAVTSPTSYWDASSPQTDLHLLPQYHAVPWSYAVLAPVSKCYPPVWDRLLTRYSPVRR